MTAPIEASSPHTMNTYGRVPIALSHGQGVRVWDVNGKQYLDGLGGIAVNTLGHAHPKLVAALQEQVATLIHCSNYYHIPGQEQLAAELVERIVDDRMAEVLEVNANLVRASGARHGEHQRRREVFPKLCAKHQAPVLHLRIELEGHQGLHRLPERSDPPAHEAPRQRRDRKQGHRTPQQSRDHRHDTATSLREPRQHVASAHRGEHGDGENNSAASAASEQGRIKQPRPSGEEARATARRDYARCQHAAEHVTAKLVKAGIAAGGNDFIVKPFDPAELRARVRAQLAYRGLAQRLYRTEKLAAMGALSAGLAHELRNPANGIVNAIAPLRELLRLLRAEHTERTEYSEHGADGVALLMGEL